MLRKFKKILPTVVSVILCVTMMFGITASAAEKNSVWSSAKALTSAKYNSNYIKWAEKYSKKDTKNTVTYSKSRTKKVLDRITKEMSADDPEYSLYMISSDRVMAAAAKDWNFKLVVSDENGTGDAAYINGRTVTMLNIAEKTMSSVTATKKQAEEIPELIKQSSEPVRECFDFGFEDSDKGKIFKFKSGEKIYYYEEFDSEELDEVGFLFSEKGTLLAMINRGDAFCISFKTTVKDSEFDLPEGYKTVDYGDFE